MGLSGPRPGPRQILPGIHARPPPDWGRIDVQRTAGQLRV
jgi:hypothetical protein